MGKSLALTEPSVKKGDPQGLFFIREQQHKKTFLGGNREGDTPDPIPNSEVKALIANGTIHKSMEE